MLSAKLDLFLTFLPLTYPGTQLGSPDYLVCFGSNDVAAAICSIRVDVQLLIKRGVWEADASPSRSNRS